VATTRAHDFDEGNPPASKPFGAVLSCEEERADGAASETLARDPDAALGAALEARP